MGAAKALEVKNLKKYFGEVKAVDGISFYALRGQVFTLLGPNGAGKTTTVEILEGLKGPDSGELVVLGSACRSVTRQLKDRMGVVLQANHFIDRIRVREMIDLFASFYSKSIPTGTILEKVSLKEKANAYVETLSGGQRQRLAIGLALVNDPEVIFLDEPTTGLDPQARRNVWDLIRQLRQEEKTIFLTTHYMDEAEQLSDYVYIMDQGRIIAHGTPQELITGLGQEQVVSFRCSEWEGVLLEGYPQAVVSQGQAQLAMGNLATELPGLLAWAQQRGYELENLAIRRPNLEDVFLTLTGKGLRD